MDWLSIRSLFCFGAMGCVIPAMIIPYFKRPHWPQGGFDGRDKLVLYIMLAALAIRILIPQVFPSAYLAFYLAATCWMLAFGLLVWRYIPQLVSPH